MEFLRIADTLTDSLARRPAEEQKAVKTTVFDLQVDPTPARGCSSTGWTGRGTRTSGRCG